MKTRPVPKVQNTEQWKKRFRHGREAELNQLRTVMKNLSLLKLLKKSNPRTIGLHSLAKSCWKLLFQVPQILRVSSRTSRGTSSQLMEMDKDPIEIGELVTMNEEVEKVKAKMGKNKRVAKKATRTKSHCSFSTSSCCSSKVKGTKPSHFIILKTFPKPLKGTSQNLTKPWKWFEGLPKRIHIPAPRSLCRPSSLRWVKRCCTRFCSASLELPRAYLYKA
ncbi:TP53-target gene 5 protein [Monodelphis domestica]|uniref:TP53 target 5 n=1 Tax=Monodelphis domestica TaxID=13616 RepID=A0A5F8G838_MONDO|nr:TP53-target gene 5 protein [Monodelphis domestica]XP_056669005.1 TP53-target gene 5 protein [Monodelphis domestica]XP_056669006.1 TP53-target gene 5 protein [Monodelphis domestica]XP_056669007.1 TP53-target gene 5 protein [Monodelphis domestica]XP_056669008.1 TP53-target gene 5 protein [Monodelphis domestica]